MGGVLSATLQRSHNHGFDAGILNRAGLVAQSVPALLHKSPPSLAYGLLVQPQLGRHFRVLTTFRTGSARSGLLRASACAVPPQHRQRRQFGALVAVQYRGASCWIAMGDSVAACLHPWHSDANLLRIYDCELVARDTKTSLYTLPMGGVGSGSPVKVFPDFEQFCTWSFPWGHSLAKSDASINSARAGSSRPQSHKAK